MRNALKREQIVDGEFTGWVAPLERILLRKDRYLAEETARPAPSVADSLHTQPENPAKTASAQPAPGQPDRPTGGEERPRGKETPRANKPAPITSFGEKLQAVLGLEK